MKKMIWTNIKRKPMTNIVFILALFLIFVMIPLVINSLLGVHEQVQSDVTYYSRGSYDLLVRPEGNNHPLEEELGLVPENYFYRPRNRSCVY